MTGFQDPSYIPDYTLAPTSVARRLSCIVNIVTQTLQTFRDDNVIIAGNEFFFQTFVNARA